VASPINSSALISNRSFDGVSFYFSTLQDLFMFQSAASSLSHINGIRRVSRLKQFAETFECLFDLSCSELNFRTHSDHMM
jgi:hypothetical protein